MAQMMHQGADMSRKPGCTPFTSETAPRQGSMKGARNKLGADFLYALQREFEQHGEDAIRIVRVEKPVEFLRVIASVLPRELEIVDGGRLKELSDEQLDRIIEFINGRIAERAGKSDGREGEALN